MKQTQLIMGMPITIEIVDLASSGLLDRAFQRFVEIDSRFSPYKKNSEVSMINRTNDFSTVSKDMRSVLMMCKDTKQKSNGYFDAFHNGTFDPSGVVKGWAIAEVASLLKTAGVQNYYVEAGGDVQVAGTKHGHPWTVGIKNPFNRDEIIKVLSIYDKGVATSGTYIRGEHIYNPKSIEKSSDIVSLTVVGPDIYEADRFATAAFAMGVEGIYFLEKLEGLEAYMVEQSGVATMTSGFNQYVVDTQRQGVRV